MAAQRIRARKRFGQNFLHDDAVIDDIIGAISPENDQHIVEIGPGRAALTKHLITQCRHLDVIEIDRDLVPLLAAQFAHHTNINIHEADALTFDYSTLSQGERLRVIGNLPYNITTPLLFHLLAQSDVIEDMCFMLQREVVERICAQPGTKNYGRLSIMVQYQCQASNLFIVPPEAFTPQPKVESAIIYLKPLTKSEMTDVSPEALNKVVSQAFSQRRKTIANTLKNMISSTLLAQLDIDVTQRPETLSIEQYIEITRLWQQQIEREHEQTED